jgi:enoyl-CoA hydratase/carnithine racemase
MTCRRFSPEEAKSAGFVNRVVPPERLSAEVEQLAAELVAKPSVPVIITKEHVNSVTRAMGAGSTAFADGDGLLSASADPESREAGIAYRDRTIGSPKS